MRGLCFYEDLAWVFRLISPPGDYAHESDAFAEMMRKHARIPVRTLLNLGCGAGHNDHNLKQQFEITGADIAQGMLALARELNPEITYLNGDMRTLRLNRQFDVVTCFDSIDYMCSEADLRAAFETTFMHLKPGGVFLTVPDVITEIFEHNSTHIHKGKGDEVSVTFIENYFDPDPSDTTYDATFVMLIRRNGELSIETDCHTLGLFPRQTWLDILRDVGFGAYEETYTDEDGKKYPVFVGVKA